MSPAQGRQGLGHTVNPLRKYARERPSADEGTEKGGYTSSGTSRSPGEGEMWPWAAVRMVLESTVEAEEVRDTNSTRLPPCVEFKKKYMSKGGKREREKSGNRLNSGEGTAGEQRGGELGMGYGTRGEGIGDGLWDQRGGELGTGYGTRGEGIGDRLWDQRGRELGIGYGTRGEGNWGWVMGPEGRGIGDGLQGALVMSSGGGCRC